jgi:hypothetical protein
MSRNVLVGVIVVLIVGIAVVGYQLYQERRDNGTVELKVDQGGIKLDTK